MRNETTVQSIKLPEVSSSHPILTLEIDQALEFLPFKYDVLHKIYPFGQQFCVWLEEGKFSRKVLMPVVDGTNTGSKRAVLGSEYSASASRHENFSKKEEPPKCDAVKNKNAQRTDTCTVFAVNGNTDDSSTPCPKEIPGWNIPNDDIVKQEDPPDPPDNSESKDWIGYFWYFVTALHACIFGENWNFLLVIYLKISAVCASQHTMEFSPVSHYVMLNPCDMCPQVPKLNCAQKEKEVCILNYDRKNLVLACVSNLLLYEACPYFTNSTKNGINYTAAVFQDVNSRCTNCSSYELWDVHNKIQCQKLDYSDAAKNCSKDINTRSDGTPDIGMIFVVCAVVLVVIVLLVGTVLCIRNTRRGQQYINFLPSFLRPRQNDQPNDVTYRSVPMEGRK
ncbi:uncharacterized protein LOC134283397 [Saccostrea cucullata]|uniref:uncharacterized protein LOC134283397 n=1 Tax=Saccostrea cuccullata TaxID=36930 RepID=UPI002ED3E1AC